MAQPIQNTDKKTFNAAGVLLEFLASPDDIGDSLCLIRGTMPPGVVVPLHCHAEPELLYVLEGSFEAFKSNQRMKGWTTASEGDLVIIPGNVKHALRNNSSGPVILALVTNAHLYRVFRALARPLNPDQHPTPPNTGSDAGALCDRGTVRILDSVAGEECRDRCESGVAMPAGKT